MKIFLVECEMLPAGAPWLKIISRFRGCQGIVVELLLDMIIMLFLYEVYDAKYLHKKL